MSTRVIAGITVPDTPLIQAAHTLAREHLDDWAYNHVMRCWVLGFAIADRLPDLANRDRELHSLAAILHDLGWDNKNSFVSPDKCFEVDGANAARAFIEQHTVATEWDRHRKQLLWDSIALHSYPPVALHKEPEVRANLFGIVAEFTGPAGAPGGALSASEWQDVVKEFPRNGLKSGVVKTLCGFCRTKPETTYLNFTSEFGEELVEGYSRVGKRGYDMIVNAVDAD